MAYDAFCECSGRVRGGFSVFCPVYPPRPVRGLSGQSGQLYFMLFPCFVSLIPLRSERGGDLVKLAAHSSCGTRLHGFSCSIDTGFRRHILVPHPPPSDGDGSRSRISSLSHTGIGVLSFPFFLAVTCRVRNLAVRSGMGVGFEEPHLSLMFLGRGSGFFTIFPYF